MHVWGCSFFGIIYETLAKLYKLKFLHTSNGFYIFLMRMCTRLMKLNELLMFLNAHGYFLRTCNAFWWFLWSLGALHCHMRGHKIDHFEACPNSISFNWSPYSNSWLFDQIGPNSILTISNVSCLCFMTSKLLISHSVFHYFWKP